MVVLDANILIRAALGRRVREILEAHFTRTRFFAPDTAIAEVREHLPKISLKRGINPESAMTVLDELLEMIACMDGEVCGGLKQQLVSVCKTVMKRIGQCSPRRWRSEDADFFGAGVATWATDRVELLLRESRADPGDELNDD